MGLFNKKTSSMSNTTSSRVKNKDGSVNVFSTTTTTSAKPANMFLLIFFIVAVILIVINFVRLGRGAPQVSFAGFLSYIQNAPRIIPVTSLSDFVIVSDWGIFNGFKNFLNIFASIFGIIAWLGSSLVNMFGYISYFVVYLFV